MPCDEELARLIREGLWHTGRGEGGKSHRGIRSGRLKKGEDEKDYKSHSSITLSSGSSRTKVDKDLDNEVKGQRSTTSTANEQRKKKSKRRITFKLDNEYENSGSSDHSSTQLDGYGSYNKGQGSPGSGTSTNVHHSGSLTSLGRVAGGEGRREGGEGVTGAKSGGRVSGVAGGVRRRRRGHTSDSLSEDSEGSGLLDGARSTRRKHKEIRADHSLLDTGGSSGKESRVGAGGAEQGKETNTLLGSLDSHDSQATDGRNGRGWTGGNVSRASGERTQTGSQSTPESTSGTTGKGSVDEKGDGGTKNSNQDSSLNSSSQIRQTGSRRGSLGLDHGRNVRKAGGYMRAVSPSSSDWGDPTHARPFISSTATSRTVSRCGSAVNLLHAEDVGGEEGRVSLPPIVPAIVNKKPLVDLSDLAGGFQFTRAWTFSYHS